MQEKFWNQALIKLTFILCNPKHIFAFFPRFANHGVRSITGDSINVILCPFAIHPTHFLYAYLRSHVCKALLTESYINPGLSRGTNPILSGSGMGQRSPYCHPTNGAEIDREGWLILNFSPIGKSTWSRKNASRKYSLVRVRRRTHYASDFATIAHFLMRWLGKPPIVRPQSLSIQSRTHGYMKFVLLKLHRYATRRGRCNLGGLDEENISLPKQESPGSHSPPKTLSISVIIDENPKQNRQTRDIEIIITNPKVGFRVPSLPQTRKKIPIFQLHVTTQNNTCPRSPEFETKSVFRYTIVKPIKIYHPVVPSIT